jgi:hypothetical protein
MPAFPPRWITQLPSEMKSLNRVRSGHQTRRVEAKQLDDGIGDTLVLIDKPNGIGNAEELKTPQDVALPLQARRHFTRSDLVDFHRIVVLKFPQRWGVIRAQ